MSENTDQGNHLDLAASIVSAFVSNNSLPAHDLPALIHAVHASIGKLLSGEKPEPVSEMKTPAVPVKKSVNDDFIICLEDGKRFKSLKRHLRTAYNMSPDEYRTKWGLNRDYPMVAPAYAVARSALAKQMGLGQKRRVMMGNGHAPEEDVEASVEAPPPARKQRRTKAMMAAAS
jgi:predicted transcriptional regulator